MNATTLTTIAMLLAPPAVVPPAEDGRAVALSEQQLDTVRGGIQWATYPGELGTFYLFGKPIQYFLPVAPRWN